MSNTKNFSDLQIDVAKNRIVDNQNGEIPHTLKAPSVYDWLILSKRYGQSKAAQTAVI